MAVIIQNDHIKVTVAEKGAELTSLQANGIEYMWQADPEYWGRHAPILFPFVGRLKDDQYTYKGKMYEMGQHGFARDLDFQAVEQTAERATFELRSNEVTRKVYPFDFLLAVVYEVWGEGLRIRFEVKNEGEDEMLFALGGHPAFNVPLEKGLDFDEYYLSFYPQKSRIQLPLKGPFVDLAQKTLGQTNTNVQLSHELFREDALIYETKGLNSFTIGTDESEHEVTLTFNHIPYVGIWSAYPKAAPFVCIEPWWGFADTVDSTGELEQKAGMNRLAPQETFKTEFSITVK